MGAGRASKSVPVIYSPLFHTVVQFQDVGAGLKSSAVVREGAEGALSHPEFEVSEKIPEREIGNLLLSAPSSPPRFEFLTTALLSIKSPVAKFL